MESQHVCGASCNIDWTGLTRYMWYATRGLRWPSDLVDHVQIICKFLVHNNTNKKKRPLRCCSKVRFSLVHNSPSSGWPILQFLIFGVEINQISYNGKIKVNRAVEQPEVLCPTANASFPNKSVILDTQILRPLARQVRNPLSYPSPARKTGHASQCAGFLTRGKTNMSNARALELPSTWWFL